MRITKQELIDTIQVLDPDLSNQAAKRALNNTLKAIQLVTQNPEDTLTLKEFGTFSRHTVPARDRHNPKTMERVHVPEYSTLKFRPSKAQKEFSQ